MYYNIFQSLHIRKIDGKRFTFFSFKIILKNGKSIVRIMEKHKKVNENKEKNCKLCQDLKLPSSSLHR